MLQQRKKDYFQRIIEEFFAKLFKLLDTKETESPETKKRLMDECFLFFFNNFDTKETDSAQVIAEKIDDWQLAEQYAKMLLIEHQLLNTEDKARLRLALDLVEIVDKNDNTFSWDRITLREDILKHIDVNN